jgi:hypothetical protein
MFNFRTQDSVISDSAGEDEKASHAGGAAHGGAVRGSSRVYSGMWGTPEVVAVTAGAVAVAAAAAVFVFAVLPARGELESSRKEKAEVESQVVSAREKYGRITSTTEQVAKLVGSADEFENSFLPPDSTGRIDLYQRINSLIATHRLINTSGPEYVALDPSQNGPSAAAESERGREKFRSIFPGVYVTTTVEGTYQDIRRFVSDIETSNQFVIISAVGIEPAEQRARSAAQQEVADDPQTGIPGIPGQTGPQQSAPAGARRGEAVSLKIELAAYFRRNAPPAP